MDDNLQEVSEGVYPSDASMRMLPVEMGPLDRSAVEASVDGAQHAIASTSDATLSARAEGEDSTSSEPQSQQQQQQLQQEQKKSQQLQLPPPSQQQDKAPHLQSSHIPPPLHPQVASIQLQAPHIDLASRRRLKVGRDGLLKLKLAECRENSR